MNLLRHGTNPHTGIRYWLLFDSRIWEWFIQARDEEHNRWVRLCWFEDLDLAELHFLTLTRKKGVKVRQIPDMEEFP